MATVPKPCLDCGKLSYASRCPLHQAAREQVRHERNRRYERARSAQHRASRAARTVGNGAAARLRRSRTGSETCSTCDETSGLAVDHIRPLWAGGTDTDNNVQWLCSKCHRVKTAGEAGLRASIRRMIRENEPR